MTKLTDAERLILINQYKILLKLEPDDDIGYEMAIDDLVHGSYGPTTDVFPKLGEAMEFHRVKFAHDVLYMYLGRKNATGSTALSAPRSSTCSVCSNASSDIAASAIVASRAAQVFSLLALANLYLARHKLRAAA